MDEGIEEFRREADKFRRRRAHQAEPWPAHLRELAAQHTARRRGDGWSLGKIAKELGISDTTLWKWTQQDGPALRPVLIELEPAQSPESAPTPGAGDPCPVLIEPEAAQAPHPAPEPGAGDPRPLLIEPEPQGEPGPQLSLISPRGYRLLGLTLATAQHLLRELG